MSDQSERSFVTVDQSEASSYMTERRAIDTTDFRAKYMFQRAAFVELCSNSFPHPNFQLWIVNQHSLEVECDNEANEGLLLHEEKEIQ